MSADDLVYRQFFNRKQRGNNVLSGRPLNPGIGRGNGPGSVELPKGAPKRAGNTYGVLVPPSEYVTIVPGNELRAYVLIQNIGTQNVFMAVGSKPRDANNFGGIFIPPTGFYELDTNVFFNDIFAISEAGNNPVSILEAVYV